MSEENSSLVNVSKDYFNKGIFLFENGKYIFIEEVQYSGDGNNWETEFEPLNHPDPNNLNNTLLGHKYRRVRHAGDDYFQKPMKIVPEDGLTPVFKVEDDKLYQKYITEDDSKFVLLYDLLELKGEAGDKGDKGEGLNISSAGYLNKIPQCPQCSTDTSCKSCSTGTTPPVVGGIGNTYLCLGKSDGTDAIEGVLSVDTIVFNSPVIGEQSLSYGSKSVTFTEVDAEDLPAGIIYIGNEVLSEGSVSISNTGAVGDVFTIDVDGLTIGTYTTKGSESIQDICLSLASSLSNGYVGTVFGTTGFYVTCPIGSGESGDSRALGITTSGAAAGTVVAFNGGVNKGANTVSEQVNKVLAITAPTGYAEEGISNGVNVTRLLTAGSVDGNLTVGNTGIDINHEIVTRGIEAIAAVVDERYPGETAGVGQTGEGVRGNVYICTELGWVIMSNIAADSYKMAPTQDYVTSNLDGLYMTDYVSPLYSITPDDGGTIAMNATSFLLGVKMNSIEPKHFKDGIFSDGLEEGSVGPEGYKTNNLFIKVDDFDGFGLKTYTSLSDGFTDLQVDVVDFIGDGLTAFNNNGLNDINSVDGEDVILSMVNVNDLVDTNLSALVTFTNTDGFDDIKVKTSYGLAIDATGLFVNVDDLSVIVDIADNKVKVKPYIAGNDGILAIHLNPDVANELKGLKVDNSTGIEILLSTDHKTLDFDSIGLKVTNHTIEGWHLNHNVADIAKGIQMDESTDMLEVLLKSAGGLMFDGGEIAIDTTDLSWLNDNVVKKVEVWEYTGFNYQGDITGDIVIEGDINADTYIDIKITRDAQKVIVKPETNVANLQQLILDTVGTGITPHTHTIPEIDGLQDELDERLVIGQVYGDFKVEVDGSYYRAPSGQWWKMSVDDNGEIITHG